MMSTTLGRQPFLLRWTLANVAGWALGLFLGGVILGIVGSILGVVVGGALCGTVVGLAQWLVLRLPDKRWLLVSAVGGGLAALPAYLSGVTLIAGPVIAYTIVGAVYGGLFGGAQWFALRHAEAGWWVAINALAGGLCGGLTLGFNPLGLPVLLSPGPVVFGLLTGVVLLRLSDDGAEI
jgi:hypothetical protein